MDMDIVITGASGYVGARLYYDLSKTFRTLGTYKTRPLSEEFEKLDITDSKMVEDLVKRYKPAAIIHTAANSSSKSCNSDPMGAISVNEMGTVNIVNAANKVGVAVIYISSTVAELQNNFYEKTKFAGESAVRKAASGYVILKPSVVFGMSPNTETDKPFNQLLRNTEGKGPFTYDTSWKFQPTWISHLSEIITSVMENNIRNKEILAVVPEMKSKFDVANDVLSSFRIEPQPVYEKNSRPSTEYKNTGLEPLGLPVRTYNEMKEGLIKEIRQKDKYVI
jgi:dTDP-4-dehydrorhamnose reductase